MYLTVVGDCACSLAVIMLGTAADMFTHVLADQALRRNAGTLPRIWQ
jgi:hypothetical protein